MTMTTYSPSIFYQNPREKSTTNLDQPHNFRMTCVLDALGACSVAGMRVPNA